MAITGSDNTEPPAAVVTLWQYQFHSRVAGLTFAPTPCSLMIDTFVSHGSRETTGIFREFLFTKKISIRVKISEIIQ